MLMELGHALSASGQKKKTFLKIIYASSVNSASSPGPFPACQCCTLTEKLGEMAGGDEARVD